MNDRQITTYNYDGSYDGYLNCLFKAVTEKGFPEILKGSVPKKLASVSIKTNNYISNLMKRTTLIHKIDTNLVNSIVYCYLYHSLNNFDECIKYFSRFLITGYKSNDDYDKHVDVIENMIKDIKTESSKIIDGLVFTENNGLKIGNIESENNIMPIAARYFILKMSDEPFILVNKKHDVVFVYKDKKGVCMPYNDVDLQFCTDEFMNLRNLWLNIYKRSDNKDKQLDSFSFYNNSYWKNLTCLIELLGFSPLKKEEHTYIKSKRWKSLLQDKNFDASIDAESEDEPIIFNRASNSFDLSYILGFNVNPLKNNNDALYYKTSELYAIDFTALISESNYPNLKALRLLEFIHGNKLFKV